MIIHEPKHKISTMRGKHKIRRTGPFNLTLNTIYIIRTHICNFIVFKSCYVNKHFSNFWANIFQIFQFFIPIYLFLASILFIFFLYNMSKWYFHSTRWKKIPSHWKTRTIEFFLSNFQLSFPSLPQAFSSFYVKWFFFI